MSPAGPVTRAGPPPAVPGYSFRPHAAATGSNSGAGNDSAGQGDAVG